MTEERKVRLEKTVAGIRERFGLRAIGRAAPQDVDVIPTGFPALDEALGTGGLPRGRLSEITGRPTSGMATLALKVVAQAQAADPHRMAAYIDLEKTFDPDYAARCGVDLARLMLVRPYSTRQALAMLPDFAVNGGFSLLVVDGPLAVLARPDAAEALATTLARIIAPLSRSGGTLLFLTSLPTSDAAASPDGPIALDNYPNQTGLPHYVAHYAAVRLLIQREQWLYRQRDVAGYAAQVLVVKNRLAAGGKQVPIAITFNGTVRGEGLT